MKNNIVLIGMPGVGKSTVGVILAKIKGYMFSDADLLIQDREKRLLCEIIEEDGIDGFLRIENEVNAQINAKNSVIATGGSVVYGEEAMNHLKNIGIVVYLKVGFEEIERRLGNIKDRGVVLKEGQTLKDLYDERTPLYEKYADITVDESGLGIEETVERITDELVVFTLDKA